LANAAAVDGIAINALQKGWSSAKRAQFWNGIALKIKFLSK
jgi:hypothetical protein